MGELRQVTLSGRPAAMGEAFGEQFRDDVRALTEARIAHLVESVAAYQPGRTLAREDLPALVGRCVDAHRRFDEAVWAEFAGIARGAGLTIEELLIGNGLTDVRDYVLFAEREPVGEAGGHTGECSAFLVSAAAAGGGPIVGQTWDMHADARPFVLLVRRKPDGAPETLGVTTAGCLCLIGLNAEGVAVGNTNLVPTDARVGVNYLFTITKALRCRSAEAAAECIEATPRMSGHNFYVADEAAAVNLETTAARAVRTVVSDGVFVHTNHYLSGELSALAFRGRNPADSEYRRDRLAANLAAVAGPVTMDDCWAALSDNTRGAGAVCNEDYEGKYDRFATLATVILRPALGELHACEGGARLGAREVLKH